METAVSESVLMDFGTGAEEMIPFFDNAAESHRQK